MRPSSSTTLPAAAGRASSGRGWWAPPRCSWSAAACSWPSLEWRRAGRPLSPASRPNRYRTGRPATRAARPCLRTGPCPRPRPTQAPSVRRRRPRRRPPHGPRPPHGRPNGRRRRRGAHRSRRSLPPPSSDRSMLNGRWWVLLTLALLVGLTAPARPAQAAAAPIVVAFYDGDGQDYSGLSQLDDEHPTYLAATGLYLMADGGLDSAGDATKLVALTHSKGVRVLQMVQNYRNGGFQAGDLRFLSSAAGRQGFTN